MIRPCILIAALAATGPVHAADAASMNDIVELGQERWTPNTSVPPGMDMMMIYGHPTKPGPFIFRARVPAGYRLPPHVHPDARVVTVIKGTYYSAAGEDFDESKLRAFPAGSFYSTPANVPHFAATRDEEVIIQEMGFGPGSGIQYVHPQDDPRPH
ncbi:MAG: cupin domain-containing protein [Burkholderiales bacterium]|nr:cupin domain-containing protein [Burkholderiales bacterium]